MKLPIDIILNTKPQKFKWKQTVKAPGGDRLIKHESPLPPSVEQAVFVLIELYKKVSEDNRLLREMIQQTKGVQLERDKVKNDNIELLKEVEKLRKQVEINQPNLVKKGK